MIIPVILSGGSGTRLWPLSRKMHPKQLLPLVNDTTMLQDTITRLTGSPDIDHAMIICNDDYCFMVAEQVKEVFATTDGVVRPPSALGMTTGSPASRTATRSRSTTTR